MNKFWRTKTGLLLRWITYIPLGLLLLVFVQSTCMVFLTWLFRDTRDFFVIGLLLGGVAAVPAAVTLYYLSFRFISDMCPSPKPGMIIFGTVFYLFAAFNIGWGIFFATDPAPFKIRLAALGTVCGLIAAKALVDIWKQEPSR